MDKDNTKDLVKSCIETYCCRSPLEYIYTHARFKWSPLIMGGDNVSMRHHKLPNTTVPRRSCIIFSHWPKSAP